MKPRSPRCKAHNRNLRFCDQCRTSTNQKKPLPSALVNLRVHELWNDLRVLTETHDLLGRLFHSADATAWSNFISENTNSEEEFNSLYGALMKQFEMPNISSIEQSGSKPLHIHNIDEATC